MGLFRYKAISQSGGKVSGAIDAEDVRDAKVKLLRLQILAIHIYPIRDKRTSVALNKKELLALSREIARLLQAGLALFESLSALEEKYRGQKSHRILFDLCEQIQTGSSLSSSLSRHAATFDVLYISMIANAEKTGRLTACFEELSQLISKQIYVRKQIVSALLYPSLLAGFCLIVLSSLLFFVIPSLSELFEGRNLHPFTQIVFAASRFVCDAKLAVLSSVLLLIGALCAAAVSPTCKQRIFHVLLKLPVMKKLFAKIAFVRFARASATLLEGGVSLIAALQQARSVMRHPFLEKIVAEAEEKVAQGKPLSSCFENHPLIPPLIPRMLGIAEQSGKLSFTMQQIAQIYEEELESSLTQFAQLAQPVLLLFLGALVGFILLSVLLPLTDVSSFVS